MIFILFQHTYKMKDITTTFWWLSEWLYKRSWNRRFSSLGGQRVLFPQGFFFITKIIQLLSRVQNLIRHQKYHDICLRCREQQDSLGFQLSKMMNFELSMRSIIKCHHAQWWFMMLEDTCCCNSPDSQSYIGSC